MKGHFVFFRLAATCFHFFFAVHCAAQLTASDSSFYHAAKSSVIKQYEREIGDQSALFNGMLYTGYPSQFKGKGPFFDSGKADTGWVFYDNILYADLTLFYDDLSEIVLIDDNGDKIALNNKKLPKFSVGGHHFVQLGEKVKNRKDLKAGFYEVLYDGNIRILKKTIREVTDDVTDSDFVQKLIRTSYHFFIAKDSIVRPVENLNELTGVLSAKKNEILRFIKKTRLKFRKEPENTILRVAAYYDQVEK